MIIDIDIKVSDSDGKVLHHLEKQFDRLDNSDQRLNFNLDIGKSFEDFLSEYMSYSGRIVREKLISNNAPYSVDDLVENEVEYRIRIGSNNLFTGKFPVNNIALKNSTEDTLKSSLYQYDDETENWDENGPMVKAIEKYEANFYQINQDDQNLVTA